MILKTAGLGFPPSLLPGSSRWMLLLWDTDQRSLHKYLTSFGLGCTFLMRYFASLLFRQLKVAPRRPPTIPIRMKKPKSTAVQRWHFLSDSEHYAQKGREISIRVVAAISYQEVCLHSRRR